VAPVMVYESVGRSTSEGQRVCNCGCSSVLAHIATHGSQWLRLLMKYDQKVQASHKCQVCLALWCFGGIAHRRWQCSCARGLRGNAHLYCRL
jgi:hypothetical protein